MTENMKAFMDAIQNNEDLKKKFDEISKGGMEGRTSYAKEYTALAKECGITLTDEDFELDEEELSDEELKEVAGGRASTDIHQQAEFMRKIMEADKKYEEHKKKLETTGDQN